MTSLSQLMKTPEGVKIEEFHPRAPPKYADYPTRIVENSKNEPVGVNSFPKNQRVSSVRVSALQFGAATAPQILDASNWFLRIFWIVAYMGLSAVFVIQFSTLVRMYLSYPVQTDLTIVRSSAATFPAVTVCNNNPVRKSLLEKVKNYVDLAALDDFVESEMLASVVDDLDLSGLSWGCNEEDEAECVEDKECVPVNWVCDGKSDCNDGSDEDGTALINGTAFGPCAGFSNPLVGNKYNAALNPNNYCVEGFIRCNITTEPICATPCDNIKECSNGYDELSSIGCDDYRQCGEDFTLANGIAQLVESPGYTEFGEYDPDNDCHWVLTSPPSSQITVSFNDLDTADNGDGCRDYVQFFDGDSDTATILPLGKKKRICGTSAPSGTITSSSNKLYITFHSDRSGSAKGFQISAVSAAARKRRDENSYEAERMATSFTLREKARKVKRLVQKRDKKIRLAREAQESRLHRRSADEDYDDSYNYDDVFANYETWYNNLNPYSHFPSDLESYDWLSAYEAAKKPDYADLRDFALFTINEIKWFGTQAVDFIAQCTFDGRDCDYKSFTTFQNPKFGNCFVFNSILNQSKVNGEYQYRSTSKTGQEYGLKLSLFTNTDEYIGVLSQNVGAQILLSSVTKPILPESQGLLLPVGFTTKMGVRQEFVQRLDKPYGECHEKWPYDTVVKFSTVFQSRWPFYSQSICEQYCIQRYKHRDCGCVDHYFEGFNTNEDAGDNDLCSHWNGIQRNCTLQVEKNYRNGELTCPCSPECSSEYYKAFSSIGEWPSATFTPYFIEYLRKHSDSEIIQNYLSTMLERLGEEADGGGRSLTDMTKIAEEIRKEFIRVEVYFQELNFEQIKQKPSYLITNLLTDFGGNIGLWIGWSVLTFLEILILILNLAKTLFTGTPC